MPPGPAAPAQKPTAAATGRQAVQPNGKPQGSAKEDEVAIQRLLKQAEMIEQRRQVLRLAGMEPHKEPARPTVHWDFMLKEMRWMAVDFTEERHWKHAIARAIAYEMAECNRRSMLKQTSILDTEMLSDQSKEAEHAEMLKARQDSGKSASTSAPCAADEAGVAEDSIFAGIDLDGDLAPSTPLNDESCIFTYAADERVSEFLGDYLNQTAEANIIAHELDLREYELDYEAAKKAAASAAAEAEKEEERRIKVLEKNPLGDFMPEEEEMLNLASKPRRVKKPHHLDEFESGFDDELEPSGLPRRSTIDRKRRLGPAMETREVKQPRREFPEGSLPRKSTTKYDSNTGKRISKPARISGTPSNRFDGQQVRPHAANAMPWSSMEDSLLCAVVHEFGHNFAFAAEILKSCFALSGVCRRAMQCKERFKQLMAPPDGQITPESTLAQQITKGQAREIMQKYMPVPEATVRSHCSILVNIGSKHKQMLTQERQREQEKGQQNSGSHASQHTVYQATISKTANRNLNAMEMIEWAATKHKREQIRQQQQAQLEQQQQAQALEVQRAQAAQQAALGGPPAAMGPPAIPSQAPTMPQANASIGTTSMQPPGFQGQSMGPPTHQTPAAMGGDPALMPGAPGAVRPIGVPTPGGSPAMSPAMQTFNGPVPAGVSQNMNTASQVQLCAQKMQQYMSQIQKLQTMLSQGKTQQGLPLTDEQRQQLNQQLSVISTHYKRLQMNYQQLRGMNPQEVQQRQQQMQMQQRQQQGMQPMGQPQAPAMRPPGYNFPAGMSAQRPNIVMQQNGIAMPQQPGMPAVGSMPPPQMNGMAMGMPPNGMMSQQGMHGHMLGQQPQAPGLAGMMSPQTASQPMQGVQQMRPTMAMQQLPKQT